MTECPICVSTVTLFNNKEIKCTKCGHYKWGNVTRSNLDKHRDKLYKISSWVREQNDIYKKEPIITIEQFDSIIAMREKRIQEQFDLMMQFFMSCEEWSYLDNQLLVKCWIAEKKIALTLVEKAIGLGFIEGDLDLKYIEFRFKRLTFDGLQYVENLDEPNKDSKNIFVAFNFGEELNKIFNTYVKDGIEELGLNYVVVNQDTTEHDKTISDEIIVKIKSSRIVIADFTNHRNSVYFEAGLAMGMKIPIIWTCKKEHTEDLSFDTRQYPHLVWENGEELKELIMNRIRVII